MELRETVLIDDTAPEALLSEWGFSVCVEYCGRGLELLQNVLPDVTEAMYSGYVFEI